LIGHGQSDNYSLATLLEKRRTSKILRGRKYTRRNVNRKMHSAQGVTVMSRDRYKRNVTCWRFVPRRMAQWALNSLLQCL